MQNKQLIDYIKQQFTQGVNEEEIKNNLLTPDGMMLMLMKLYILLGLNPNLPDPVIQNY